MSLARRWLVPGLIAGALMRAVALPLAGTSDVDIWKTWAYGASADLSAAYGVGGSPPERRDLEWQARRFAVDYPPLALEELAISGALYRRLDAAFEDSRLLGVLVKLPGLCWEVFFVVAMLTWGRRRVGDDAAATIALGWWLNPALVLNGAALGYLDTAMLAPAALALIAAWAGAVGAAALLTVIALLTKAQALFVLPAVALAAWRGGHARRPRVVAVVPAVLAAALVLLPFVFRGTLPNVVAGVERLGTQDILSGYAANAWWLVTWGLRVVDMAPERGWTPSLLQETRILPVSSVEALGYPSPRLIGMSTVAAAFAWGLWRRRHLSSLAEAAGLAAWCACTYVMFATQVHENHLALALPFVVIAAALDPRWHGPAAAVTAIAALNLVLFYGWGTDAPLVIPRGITGVDASVVLAALNLAAFAWLTRTALRRS